MLSEQIKVTRKKAFLSQAAFAKEIGVAESTINRWETGKGLPNLAAMKSIKDFCGRHNLPYETMEEEWIKTK